MNYLRKFSLPNIIIKDLLKNKISFFLLFFLLISAFFVVIITYDTRILNEKLEYLYLEYIMLDSEKKNLY